MSELLSRTRLAVFLAAVSLAVGCNREAAAPASAPAATPPREVVVDIHSYARPDEAHVTDVALDLRADLEAKRLAGTATLTFQRRPGATEIVLDSRDLDIEKVADGEGAELKYTLGPADPIKGQPLTI